MEKKHRDIREDLHMVFIGLKTAFNIIPRIHNLSSYEVARKTGALHFSDMRYSALVHK